MMLILGGINICDDVDLLESKNLDMDWHHCCYPFSANGNTGFVYLSF